MSSRPASDRPTAVIVGPLPPPIHGVSVLTKHILNSKLSEDFDLLHLDTTDPRPMDNAGRFDFTNAYLALLHGFRFLKLTLRRRPALVYVQIAQSALGVLRDALFLVPARWFGVRTIVHLNGGYFDQFYRESNGLTRAMIRFIFRHVDLGLVLAERFRGIFGPLLPPERVDIVENGAPDDLGEFRRSFHRETRSTVRVVFMATMLESKGFVDVLHAVPEVLRNCPDTEVYFVGDGSGFPEYAAAKEWVIANGLEGKAIFTGPRWGDDKLRTLCDADIFVFPTWYPWEGQPVVLIEAMAAGLPIVTTRHAANDGTVGEEGALYVEKHNPADIAEKLTTLIRDSQLRAKMGKGNRERYLRQYTVDAMAASLGRAFWQVLGLTKRQTAPMALKQGQGL